MAKYSGTTLQNSSSGSHEEQAGTARADTAGTGQGSENSGPAVRARPVDLIEDAKWQLTELTGSPVDRVSGFGKSDNGWSLTVVTVELRRIPEAMDVLAEYEVDLDTSGVITGYRRGRRFYRGEVGAVV